MHGCANGRRIGPNDPGKLKLLEQRCQSAERHAAAGHAGMQKADEYIKQQEDIIIGLRHQLSLKDEQQSLESQVGKAKAKAAKAKRAARRQGIVFGSDGQL